MAGDAFPGLGITRQMSSFPAKLTWASAGVSWRPGLCPVCPRRSEGEAPHFWEKRFCFMKLMARWEIFVITEEEMKF